MNGNFFQVDKDLPAYNASERIGSILEWSFSSYNQQMVIQGTSCYLL